LGFSVIMKVSIEGRTAPVWDLPVRLFHWGLVACVVTAAATGFLFPANWLSLHVWAGAGVGALILARLVWGVTGSTYARFANFTLAPAAVLAHLKDISSGRVHREGGHNPLGAWMVVALLLMLSGIVVSGLLMLGGMFKQGPGKGFLSFALGDFAREPHEILAWLLLALVAAHIAGMAFESRRSGENLARAMVTGRKAEGFVPAPKAYVARNGLALAVVVAGGALLAVAGFFATTLPPRGVPQMVADATWKTECGDCHMAFHPTLLPAQSWNEILAHLDDHFGEDASLPAEKVAKISAFLAANSAETSDSFAANRFRRISAERPLEITATPFWVRRHGDIAEAVFKAAPVNSKQNCAACHADAGSGSFAPQAISIPQETSK
jgi:cytochrome b